jgi:hypothetical protein
MLEMSRQDSAIQGLPVKHSFSNTYRAGENPPDSQAAEPGLLVLNPQFAGKALKALRNEKNRKLRQARKRQRKWYHNRRDKLEAARRPVHPTLDRSEALAVEEAALLG